MTTYDRKQTSNYLVYGPLFFGPAFLVFLFPAIGGVPVGDFLPAALGVAMVLTLVFAGSSALRVTVTPTELQLRWRLGWPLRLFDRSEIQRAEAVRNKWWYGWGIRRVPSGWMWNVWGLDAVEILLTNGKRFRIGTDDPDGLTAALRL